MLASPTDDLRTRLEGRAEVLEATVERYRALRRDLASLLWRDRLRAEPSRLHQVVLAQPFIDEVLDVALRRMNEEQWPVSAAMTATLQEAALLRDALRALAAKRLGEPASNAPLTALLASLELELTAGRKDAAALLPLSLPAVLEVAEVGDALARLLNRPLDANAARPLPPAILARLATVLPQAETALEQIWSRVELADPSGELRADLNVRSREAPPVQVNDGVEAVLRAAFWVRYARTFLVHLLDRRAAPVEVDARLVPHVARWLAEHDTQAGKGDDRLRLATTDRLGVPAAAFISLAVELNDGLPQHPASARWPYLLALAEDAEALAPTRAGAQLRVMLERFIRPRLARKVILPSRLSLLVARAREVCATEPVTVGR